MPLVDLSHTLLTGMAQYPGDEPPPLIIPRQTHTEHGHMSSAMALGCHVGTHLDTPYHFRDGEPGLDALPLDMFHGTAQVVVALAGQVPGPLDVEVLAGVDLGQLDYLIFRTGWEQHWNSESYYASWPYLAIETGEVLAAADLKGVGLDTPSVDPLGGRAVHDLFAAAGMVNVENLTNLVALPSGLFEFQALPLKLAGTEASPVRAVGRF